MTHKCESLLDDESCQEPGTHFLINRGHGPGEIDKVLAALKRDFPADPILQVQLCGWFCDEHMVNIHPIMKEIAVSEFMETL
jgi:hypothetical protein